MKVIQYYIVVRSDITSLSDAVAKYVREGWEPHGSMVANSLGYFMQPIVKREGG